MVISQPKSRRDTKRVMKKAKAKLIIQNTFTVWHVEVCSDCTMSDM